MKTASTDDARRNLRAILNDVERNGEHYQLQRFGETAAVVVPWDWYQRIAGYEKAVDHLDGDPRNNDLANLEVREVKDGSDE